MRICPGCRSVYDESVHVCEKDGLPLLDVSPTFAAIKGDQLPEAPTPTAGDLTLKPGMMVGEYMIERTIAEGGMGHVYAGIHPVISKRVAIKVLSKRFASDAKAISRFVLEARSVNQIGHHNIVDIFSIGELDDGRNYLIMELLDGLPMHEVLRNVKRFKPGEILPVYQQLCDALEAAHQKSFVHRDLKPDNVLVLRRPPHPFIKILDFGIAKLRGSSSGAENTEVGTVLGTPEYMAPEQCRGGQIDARVDIYALGVMFYELVTGRKPFTDPNPLRILSKQMREQPVPPSRLAPIPKALEMVILKAMAKDPNGRQSTVRELYEALAEATPELLPWRASLTRPAAAAKKPQDEVRTIPPDSAQPVPRVAARPPRPRQVSVPAPVAISDSIDTSQADEEEQTLVAEAKPQAKARPKGAQTQVKVSGGSPAAPHKQPAHAQPAHAQPAHAQPAQGQPAHAQSGLAPMPMSSKVTTGELDDAETEVGPVDRLDLGKAPPAAFGTAGANELDDVSTIVEDDEPVMLVDRPIEDVVRSPGLVQSRQGQISSTYEQPSVPTAQRGNGKGKTTGPPLQGSAHASGREGTPAQGSPAIAATSPGAESSPALAATAPMTPAMAKGLKKTSSDETTGERPMPAAPASVAGQSQPGLGGPAGPAHKATVPMPPLRFDAEGNPQLPDSGENPIEPKASFELMVDVTNPDDPADGATVPLEPLTQEFETSPAAFEDRSVDLTGPGPAAGGRPVQVTPNTKVTYGGNHPAAGGRSARKEPPQQRSGGVVAAVVVGAVLTAAVAVGVAYYLGLLG